MNEESSIDFRAKLLPCPFCARKDLLGIKSHPESKFLSIRCRACGCIGPANRAESVQEAIGAWMRRSNLGGQIYSQEALDAAVAEERQYWKDAAEAMALEAEYKIGGGAVADWLRLLYLNEGSNMQTRRKPPKYRATARPPLAIFFAALTKIKSSQGDGITRAQLCKEVGISTSTVKKLIAEGVACGYLEEFEPMLRPSNGATRGKIAKRVILAL